MLTKSRAAQLVTMGKRACIWLFDLLKDLQNLERVRNEIRLKGLKGATGTQASYLTLMKGDAAKVYQLEEKFCEKAGFSGAYPIAGQTSSRKVDTEIVTALASLGSSFHKIFTDIRLLCAFHEIGEPFGTDQIGSSAMPYKQNPARSERCCGIARHLMTICGDTFATHSVQWLERTLDDSSNKRLVMPEAFLCADAILQAAQFVFEGMGVNEKIVEKRLNDEIHNLISEEILVAMNENGADRQTCHEELRKLSLAAGARVRDDPNLKNDLLDRIRAEKFFAPIHGKLDELVNAKRLVGLAPNQVERFIANDVKPVLDRYSANLTVNALSVV